MTASRRAIVSVLGVGVVVVVYWLVSPLFITRRVAEEFPVALVPATNFSPSGEGEREGEVASPVEQSGPKELARGTFEGLAGHRAQGTARIIEIEGKRYVRFESDFRVTNGPDLFVYLGREGKYDPNVRLAALKGNEGSQNYELPTSHGLAAYDAVWVWCRAFSVPFGKATFVPTTPAG